MFIDLVKTERVGDGPVEAVRRTSTKVVLVWHDDAWAVSAVI